ncbi:uncharacterized protein LOC101457713 [Ceratitis capitata]|uniref:Regulatory protein zeste n=1 Tax=Ceratitis capitata TaxID=7213 RepID=A0A811V3Y2_CERCA|nr:uncharacterized protein LOC101457713 [Ceratitis capitata]CAD7006149.1 unnamed protein product [Ceratitis capitata]
MSKRCPNFTINEEDFLWQLVDLRKNVLENKKTDRITTAKKTKAWIDLEEEFNKKFGHIFRNAKELRTKYDNLKKKRRKEHIAMAGKRYGIGGGIKDLTAATNNDRVTHKMSPFVEDDEDLNDGGIEGVAATTNNDRNSQKISAFVEDYEDLHGENGIDPLTSSATNKSQVYELQMYRVEEQEVQIRKQELVIEMTKKEHNLKIKKMELELEISKVQLQQMKNDLRNLIYV